MPSKPNILIVGQSGSGKTCSLEQLLKQRPVDVAFIDFERKGLPFLLDTKKLGFFSEPKTYDEAQAALLAVKATKCPIVIYDSFSKICELIHDACRDKYTGWDVWNGYNKAISNFIKFNKDIERLVIMTALDEVVYIEQAEGARTSRLRAYVQGKVYEGKIEREFLVVLFVSAKKDKNGLIQYRFSPHTDGITSAKSPQWLALPTDMPNDVNQIVNKLEEAKVL